MFNWKAAGFAVLGILGVLIFCAVIMSTLIVFMKLFGIPLAFLAFALFWATLGVLIVGFFVKKES